MTQDRIANWGESESAARYQTGDDDPDGGNFIVARDLDGERVLLQFDYDADEWQYAGDVDMGGGDLNSVGTARVDALEAELVSTDEVFISEETIKIKYFEVSDGILEIPFPEDITDRNGPRVEYSLDVLRLDGGGGPFVAQLSDDGGSSYETSSSYEFTFEEIGTDGSDNGENDTRNNFIKISNGTNRFNSHDDQLISIKTVSPGITGNRTHFNWNGATRNGSELARLYGVGMLNNDFSADMVRFGEEDDGTLTAIDDLVVRRTTRVQF